MDGTSITRRWANASVRDQPVRPFASAAARDQPADPEDEGGD